VYGVQHRQMLRAPVQVRYAAVRRQTAAHAGEKELQVTQSLCDPMISTCGVIAQLLAKFASSTANRRNPKGKVPVMKSTYIYPLVCHGA